MVARGIVREARKNVEAQQIKLKEVRDRLDRVSREDIQYLELATLEHRLLQVREIPGLMLGDSGLVWGKSMSLAFTGCFAARFQISPEVSY